MPLLKLRQPGIFVQDSISKEIRHPIRPVATKTNFSYAEPKPLPVTTKLLEEVVKTASSFFMKRFLIFILLLSVLITSEYYFFSELFSGRRLYVLLPGLTLMLLSVFGIFRFVKKISLQAKRN